MKIAIINGPRFDGSLFTREGRCTQPSSLWSTPWPPISLAYLAAVFLRDNHQPFVLDCPASNISFEDLRSKMAAVKPDLCIISLASTTLEDDFHLVRILKRTLPDLLVAVIGVHGTVLDEQTLSREPNIDAVIRGEPEETARELAAAIEAGQDFQDIRGVSFHRGGRFFRNDDRPYLADLDQLPFPAWQTLNGKNYLVPFSRRPFLSVSPLRGCPHACTFCAAAAYYGKAVRLRDPERVEKEIRHDRKRFGVDDFFMWAETFTIDRDFVLGLTQRLKNLSPPIRWTCNSRIDTIDEKMAGEMASAGCWLIGFGIESADSDILAKAGKSQRDTDAASTLRMVKKRRIQTLGHFVLGLPGETQASLQRTVRLVLSLDLDFVQVYAAAPFVGSPLFRQALDRGWLQANTFAPIDQRTASLALATVSKTQVNRARSIALLRFYLRPSQIRRLMRAMGFGLFRHGFAYLWSFFRTRGRLRTPKHNAGALQNRRS